MNQDFRGFCCIYSENMVDKDFWNVCLIEEEVEEMFFEEEGDEEIDFKKKVV